MLCPNIIILFFYNLYGDKFQYVIRNWQFLLKSYSLEDIVIT